ncbi:MAG: phage integrase N-terminal SAM-like domain-containing protein [Nitrospirae bacterium]|nr:phage integrase N-terminal SAM-like domain-containing protein [Nitrospirota bacterium]
MTRHADYRKWLRYYLDFRGKYSLSDSKSEQVRLFVEKLKKKNQMPEQQKQAAHAISLFFESQLQKNYNETPLVKINTDKKLKVTSPSTFRNHNSPYPPLILRGGGEAGGVTIKGESSNGLSRAETALHSSLRPSVASSPNKARFNEWRCLAKSGFSAWDKVIDTLAAEIKTRHYSRKTLKTYADWSRKFQGYPRNKLA